MEAKTEKFSEWAIVEMRLIKRLQPKFNCVGSVKNKGQEFDRWSWVIEQ